MLFQLTVAGDPVAKPRMSNRDRFKPALRVQYFRAWADTVRFAARGRMGSKELLGGPLILSCVFYMPIPKSWPSRQKQSAANGEWPHITKPDIKNLIAGIEDIFNGIVWVDDSQIVEYAYCRKKYSERPGVSVLITVPNDVRVHNIARVLGSAGISDDGIKEQESSNANSHD